MFLGGVGDAMAKLTRYLYASTCCYLCNRRRLRSQYSQMQENFPDDGPNGGAAWETEERINKLRNKKGPKTRKERLRLEKLERQLEAEKAKAKLEEQNGLALDQDEGNPVEQMSVPVTLTMCIIASYVLLGAVIFGEWEPEWDMVIGAYFSFTTLSTIGLGDFVPGSTSFGSDENTKMLISSLYIIVGLSVISMSLNLAQEEIIDKFRWLGSKLGIIDEDEDDSEFVKEDFDEMETSLTHPTRKQNRSIGINEATTLHQSGMTSGGQRNQNRTSEDSLEGRPIDRVQSPYAWGDPQNSKSSGMETESRNRAQSPFQTATSESSMGSRVKLIENKF